MNKKLLILLILVCFLFSVSVASAKEVRIVLAKEPTGFDPQKVFSADTFMVMFNIYDTLVDTDDGCSTNIRPKLAESWDISDDGLTYTFHLRKGVKFHNGETFSSADVKYSIERAMVLPASADYCTMIESVEAVDAQTVVVNLNMRFADFLQNFGGIYFAIVNEKAVEDAGADYGRKPVGTGPYQFVKWVPGQSVTLQSFDEFWGGAVSIKNITFKILPDKSTALIALQNGEVDAFPNTAPLDAATVKNDKNLALYYTPGVTIVHMGLNSSIKPFNNKLVRQAIQYAIDKEGVFMGAQNGDGVIANSPLTETMSGYNKDWPPINPYNVEKAKELMAEAGYADGFTTTLIVFVQDNMDKAAQIIQAQLKEISIDVKIEIIEKAAIFDILTKGNYETYILGLNWPNSDNMLTFLYDSTGVFNWGGVYSNPEVDALLLEARKEINEVKRAALYQKIIEITYESGNKIPLYHPNQYFAANKDLKGIKIIDNCYFPVEKWSWAQ